MTVQELIALLQEYANPDDSVEIMSSYYNGSEDVYETGRPTIVVGYNEIIISPTDIYHIRESQAYGHVFCTIHPDGTVT